MYRAKIAKFSFLYLHFYILAREDISKNSFHFHSFEYEFVSNIVQ